MSLLDKIIVKDFVRLAGDTYISEIDVNEITLPIQNADMYSFKSGTSAGHPHQSLFVTNNYFDRCNAFLSTTNCYWTAGDGSNLLSLSSNYVCTLSQWSVSVPGGGGSGGTAFILACDDNHFSNYKTVLIRNNSSTCTVDSHFYNYKSTGLNGGAGSDGTMQTIQHGMAEGPGSSTAASVVSYNSTDKSLHVIVNNCYNYFNGLIIRLPSAGHMVGAVEKLIFDNDTNVKNGTIVYIYTYNTDMNGAKYKVGRSNVYLENTSSYPTGTIMGGCVLSVNRAVSLVKYGNYWYVNNGRYSF